MRPLFASIVAAVVLLAGGCTNNRGKIIIPYIAHQKPFLDPHVPHAVPLADKLSELVFDGLFNARANASGVTYEDGLGEFVGIKDNVVTIRLKPNQKWHSSYSVTMKKDKVHIDAKEDAYFTANDLRFTLQRIRQLGSLSPDYILVSQAVEGFDFTGPDHDNLVQFQFRSEREWEPDQIKEVLSFKILPAGPPMDAPAYTIGTGPYLLAGEQEDVIYFYKAPDAQANIPNVILKPFIDNSTYTTELNDKHINVLLSTPFGALSPILADSGKFFHKSSIATCCFALLHNCDRLSLAQRQALRKLVNNRMIMERFFKLNSPQQRHIANYKGEGDNYDEYLNYSVFPSTSIYIEDTVVTPLKEQLQGDLAALPDTVRIQTCLNYDFREELSELMQIMNDPAMFHGKIKVTAVSDDEIRKGDYDAVLAPITGYRSNFLFDLYSIYLRDPDFAAYGINLKTRTAEGGGEALDESSIVPDKNFFRLDLGKASPDQADFTQLYDAVYSFMATHEIGDKQHYARVIDSLDQKLMTGTWLFSLPALAYLNTQFDEQTVDMYGAASQLSTIGKWQERKK